MVLTVHRGIAVDHHDGDGGMAATVEVEGQPVMAGEVGAELRAQLVAEHGGGHASAASSLANAARVARMPDTARGKPA